MNPGAHIGVTLNLRLSLEETSHDAARNRYSTVPLHLRFCTRDPKPGASTESRQLISALNLHRLATAYLSRVCIKRRLVTSPSRGKPRLSLISPLKKVENSGRGKLWYGVTKVMPTEAPRISSRHQVMPQLAVNGRSVSPQENLLISGHDIIGDASHHHLKCKVPNFRNPERE